MNRMQRSAATLALAALTTPAAQAADFAPLGFAHANQHVLMAVHGLPELGRAVAPAAGEGGWSLDVDWTSEYTTDDSQATAESIVLDGETVRVTAGAAFNIDGWLVEARVPYVTHSAGRLDEFINDWHDFTGLPSGGRDAAPNDRLRFVYVRDGQRLVDVTEATGGIGDVRLGVARPVGRTVVRVGIKLPTGDAEKLTGSGGVGGSVSVDFQGPGGTWWGTHGGVGVLAMSSGDLLPDQQRNVAGVGSLGLGIRLLDALTAKVSLYGHTPLYEDSALGQIARGALVITTGGSLRLGDDTVLDFGVAENPVARSAPDVSFHFALRRAL